MPIAERRFAGRPFRSEELTLIHEMDGAGLSRMELAATVCELLRYPLVVDAARQLREG